MQFCRLTAVRVTDTTNGSPDARASSHGFRLVSTYCFYTTPARIWLTRIWINAYSKARKAPTYYNLLFVYLSLQAPNGGVYQRLGPPRA